MALAVIALIGGIALLVWSADKFVDGSSATASHLGMSPLLIGMVVVGFGTSTPEMVVSTFAALEGSPGIALGNAYGSNITNIALILGLSALINPILVHSQVIRRELPILIGVSALAAYQLWDGNLSRMDAAVLLGTFAAVMGWTIHQRLTRPPDALEGEMQVELATHPMSLKQALTWVGLGLVLLIASSRILVWAAVEIAHAFGVSDLIIGLTVIALGTSLPELASSIIASRKGEHDIALGNIIGSNFFNTLVVVGIAAAISPMTAEPAILSRDISVMIALTLSLFVMGYGFGREGRIGRVSGTVLMATYVGYTAYLISTVVK